MADTSSLSYRGSSPAVLQTLEWIRASGFRPVPLPLRKKGAAIEGYNEDGWVPPPDGHWQTGDCGIGVLTGPARDGPIDIDLDCHEALFFAEKFFPPTQAVFGRKGKLRSHRLYKVVDDEFRKIEFKDPLDKTVILELRGDKHQTVFPGSLHEGTGELIEWSDTTSPDVPTVDVESLHEAAKMTVMAVLVARHVWHAGARNDQNMALGGMLLKRGWNIDKIKELIGAVMEFHGDTDKSRFKTLARTATLFENDEAVKGEKDLRQLLGPESSKVIGALAKLAGGNGGVLFPDRRKNGSPVPSVPNTVVALGELEVEVRYDLFKQREMISGHALSEFAGDVQDPVLHLLREMIHEAFGFYPGRDTILDAVHTIGNHHRFHPVRDFLDSLKWDGVPRIDRWLIEYAGADDTEFIRAAGGIFLTAAVRRVRQPGCKFDEVLVLEGEQGRGKSRALKILTVMQEWFTDQSPLGRSDKEVIEIISGRWIVEIAELKGMRNAAIEGVKSFASRQVDRARMAYAMTTTEAPRQCVFFATTNDDQYLRDQTGNRRFWPVRIEQFDLKRLEADREQLWAEAAYREASDNSEDLIRLPEELWDAAAEQQNLRVVENPFFTELSQLLRDRDGQSMEGKIPTRVLMQGLDLPPARQNQYQLEQIAAAMKKLGWRKPDNKNGKLRFDGDVLHCWVKGDGPAFRSITIDTPFRDVDGRQVPAVARYTDEFVPSGIPGQD